MRRIDRHLIISFTSNMLLLTLLIFFASYFFIGKNLDYLSKTQNQINEIVVYEVQAGNIDKALEYARLYNVGVAVTDDAGKEKSQAINENTLVLRGEFLGRVITRELTTSNGKQTIELTYFRPLLAGDNTVKFLPVYTRVFAVSVIFSLIFSLIIAFANGSSIKRDIKRARDYAANIVKGSSKNSSEKAVYVEINEIFNELNALQEIVSKKEALKKRMTSDIAHELRTPLTTLQSHLEALIDGIWQPTTERFVSCHEEILRLIRIVADLEKLSKMEDDNLTLKKTHFDLAELVRSLSLNFQGELNQKKLSLSISGTEQPIYADKDKISQVLVNLISNSMKYTSFNGRILLDIKGDKDYVYLVINDSGIGISSKDIPNVFNRLYRTDASRARATGGAGIGLAIAKSILEAHRGSVDLVSQEGLGTEITVILPRK